MQRGRIIIQLITPEVSDLVYRGIVALLRALLIRSSGLAAYTISERSLIVLMKGVSEITPPL